MTRVSQSSNSHREPELKAAVIDALFSHDWIDADAVIVSEMPLPRGDRRADLVLANGKLIGFEIKSVADTTSRLAGQAAAFLEQFEGLVVVVDERHYADAERLLPPAAGIFTSREMDGRIEICIRRKVHVRPLDRQASVRLMHAADLQKLARRHGLPITSTSRYGLEQVIEVLPQHIVRKAALDAVKRRYRRYFDAYRDHRAAGSNSNGLEFLRKPAWQTERRGAAHTQDLLPAPSPADTPLVLNVIPRTIRTHLRQDQRRALPLPPAGSGLDSKGAC